MVTARPPHSLRKHCRQRFVYSGAAPAAQAGQTMDEAKMNAKTKPGNLSLFVIPASSHECRQQRLHALTINAATQVAPR